MKFLSVYNDIQKGRSRWPQCSTVIIFIKINQLLRFKEKSDRSEENNMNPKTAKTLVWAAASGILLGMVVISPAGGLFLYSIAALFAVIPTIFSTKGYRIAGGFLLAASLVLLAVTYPQYDAEMTSYRESVYKRSAEGAKPAAPVQPERRQGEKR